MKTFYLNIVKLFFLLVVVVIVSCDSKEIKTDDLVKGGYSIHGSTTDTNFSKVYLYNNTNKKVDSAKITNNEFLLQGKIDRENCYSLRFDSDTINHLLILENAAYKMLIDDKKSMLIGGELNTIFNRYKSKKEVFAKQKSNLIEEFSKMNIGLKSYLEHIDSIRKIEKKLFISFILDNDTTILPSILIKQTKLSSKEVNTLQKKLVASENRRLLRELDVLVDDLKLIEAEERILRRKPVPLFSGVNLNGSKTSLEKLIKGKKAFLIDFWASWCMPCREMSPRLKELYRKYKRRGFDILSVSEDRNVSDWKNAVYIDGIGSWHHVYDDFNRISSMFNVTSMPHMVLLDDKGRIIKNKISIDDLEKQLDKIFNTLEK